jgi:pimeloyl-ACP methyl ester carboxylesterase
MKYREAVDRSEIFVAHEFDEHTVDLGEVRLNYSVVGDPDRPALLLIPSQSESWWGYERAMPLLAEHFQVYAVDLRGQGRSTWTPGRYTLDNFGNDLVRFIDLVIGRPVVVAGNSSGGVLAAWLSAFAKPGQIRASVWEDAPLFASEESTSCGLPIRQNMGPAMALWSKWLGDQWSIGDWAGMQKAVFTELPAWMPEALMTMAPPIDGLGSFDSPPQNLKEYDPEWGRSFVTGLASAACDHATMLENVKVPVLFTHHFHRYDETTGVSMGAISDLQVRRVEEIVTAAGQAFTYRSFPDKPHVLHMYEPELYASTLVDWVSTLG